MARREPKPRDTKQRLLDAALAVFAERGYRDASIDEIAARAGATKGALYYWFEDKQDLARDLCRGLWERVAAEAMAAFDPDADMVSNLHRGMEAYLRALRNLPEARFFLRDCLATPELSSQDLESWVPVVRSMLDEGITRGELRPFDPDALARVLLGAYSEATLHILTTGQAGPTVEVLRHLVESLRMPAGRARPTSARKGRVR